MRRRREEENKEATLEQQPPPRSRRAMPRRSWSRCRHRTPSCHTEGREPELRRTASMPPSSSSWPRSTSSSRHECRHPLSHILPLAPQSDLCTAALFCLPGRRAALQGPPLPLLVHVVAAADASCQCSVRHHSCATAGGLAHDHAHAGGAVRAALRPTAPFGRVAALSAPATPHCACPTTPPHAPLTHIVPAFAVVPHHDIVGAVIGARAMMSRRSHSVP